MLEAAATRGEVTLSPRQVAVHEAGHAIGALEVGYPLATVSIVEDAATLGRLVTLPGWQERSRYTDPSERILVEAAILVHLAGPAASAYLAGCEVEPGCDERRAMELARALGNGQRDVLDGYLGWQRVRARVLVSKRWSRVEAVAEALLEYGTLTAANVRFAARQADEVRH